MQFPLEQAKSFHGHNPSRNKFKTRNIEISVFVCDYLVLYNKSKDKPLETNSQIQLNQLNST